MKLEAAKAGQVVRNKRNSHFYRFVRKEGRRVRIRPLELFPNGLLQEKTTDTIVEADLQIEQMGEWHDDFYVQDKPKHRAGFERELAKETIRLADLEELALIIDPKERGSHANRVKAVARRVFVLRRGLVARPEDTAFATAANGVAVPRLFNKHDLVSLPSGRPAKVKCFVNGTKTRILVNVRDDCRVMLVPTAILVPYAKSRQASHR